MNRKIELLAPGGDIDSIKAAILAGANAVYCGLDKFNARNRATNIIFEDLQGILRLAHKNNCKVFLTLNIIVVESEISALINLLNKLINTSIDGIIVQDLGLFYILSNYFKGFNVHASTQLTTHNEGQVNFLSKLNASRVNLSRELNIAEIKELTSIAHDNNVLTEVFVHGSNCISFSGICYISSVHGGNSGNRGRCSQPCRDRYETTSVGIDYPLNLKDNSAYFDLKKLADAGVDSLKIEGRIKKSDYVYTIVNTWKKQLQSFYNHNKLIDDNSDLYKVFNRDFSNAYLKGEINKDMFIDNPRDHSIKHLSEINDYSSNSELEKDQLALYNEKEDNKLAIENEIKKISISKAPLKISISGECGFPLKISVTTPETSFDIFSEINLVDKGTEALSSKIVLKRFKAFNDTEYFIKDLNIKLQGELYIPFKELTSLKKRILFILNDLKEFIDPVDISVIKKQNKLKSKPSLSVLISSFSDVYLCDETNVNIYFQLPSSVKKKLDIFTDFFIENKKLIPWFPSVLIGEDYTYAVKFLQKIQPKTIVTDNTGIAFEAYNAGINWIAGPYLNVVNSYSLLSLKENFNCSGSFISNEISKEQIQSIKRPDDFNLYYKIYHPVLLMTSRQCLFHQVTGCQKNKIDETCIKDCEKHSSITNMKNDTVYIEKSKGNYHRVYNENNELNLEIIAEIPEVFSSFFIDLRNIKTKTELKLNKVELIKLFEDIIDGNPNSKNELNKIINPSTNIQYKKGI